MIKVARYINTNECVLIDEVTSGFELSELQKAGYSIWDMKQKQIMKSILKKEKINCSVNCGFL